MKGAIYPQSNMINGVFNPDNPENVCISASAGSRRYNTTTSCRGGGHTHHEVLLSCKLLKVQRCCYVEINCTDSFFAHK